ncbi:VOC family protein [Sphingomonas alpina]|uniref:VOC family protein n=1 Tax=Sphingomonas alpina TaxID=653931 RepID=A0A7H0LI98_9SPHN|nr:VOC family protein [Sphingomonas alpina]QNQ09401.1 VOC family protein [Sphingomonas alpina]
MPVAIVSIPVTDLDRARAFYVDTLGLALLRDAPMGPDMRWIQLQPKDGGATIALVTWFEQLRPGGQQGLMLGIDDVDAEHARLTALGLELPAVAEEPWGRYIMLTDPDGNGLILSQLTDPQEIRTR